MKHHYYRNKGTAAYGNTANYPHPTYTLDALTAQAKLIVKHMAKAGSITLREALADHSIQSLTRRITEIKAEGIAVHTVRSKHPITGQRYSRYSLVKPQLVAL